MNSFSDGSHNYKLENTCRKTKFPVDDWSFLRNIIISMCCNPQPLQPDKLVHMFFIPFNALTFSWFLSRNQFQTKIFK